MQYFSANCHEATQHEIGEGEVNEEVGGHWGNEYQCITCDYDMSTTTTGTTTSTIINIAM